MTGLKNQSSYGNVTRNSIDSAARLVATLLEAPAHPPYGFAVFGPDIPERGNYFIGREGFGTFLRTIRGSDALLDAANRKKYVTFLTNQGYILIFKVKDSLRVYSKVKLHIAPDGINLLERTMGMDTRTPVTFNGQQTTAGALLYAQPQAAGNQPPTQGQPGSDLIKGSFGGLYGPNGRIESGSDVNISAMERGMDRGYAYVIRYPNGGINVALPKKGYAFTAEEIKQMEQKMGLTPKTPAQVFPGSVDPALAYKTTAESAVYPKPTQKPQPNLATAPPDLS